SPANVKVWGDPKFPRPSPSSTVTALTPTVHTARSSLWSPLTSPTLTQIGDMLVPKVWTTVAVRKVPSPLPSSTETSLDPPLATARSRWPSPLKSPMATEYGLAPTARSIAGAGLGSADRRTNDATAITNEFLVISDALLANRANHGLPPRVAGYPNARPQRGRAPSGGRPLRGREIPGGAPPRRLGPTARV